MKDFIEYLVKQIVTKPEEVQVYLLTTEYGDEYHISVNKDDMGLLIGKEGKTIKSIRAIAKAKAIKDIENGKLTYFGFHPRESERMTEILAQFGIETKEHLGRCVRIGGFEPFCYQQEMRKEIDKKYGKNFIDSIFRVAQKEYILKNPKQEYIEDGVDLREKYKIIK